MGHHACLYRLGLAPAGNFGYGGPWHRGGVGGPAIGLFAAIPAVVAYNRFARDIDRVAIRLETFIEEFSNILQRNLGAQSVQGVNAASATASGH